jgi:hypothetical protein
MTSTLRFTAVSLFFVFAARAFAAVTLTNLVDEQSPLVLSIHDVPTLIKNWEQSPWAKTWNDEQMKKFLAPLRAQMKVDEWDELSKAESGYTVTEVIAMAKGEALIALTGTDFAIGDSLPTPGELPVLMAIELGANAKKVTEMIAKADEKGHDTPRTEDFAGVTLHIYQKAADQGGAEYLTWAMTEGIWLLSPSKVTLQKSIDAVQKGRSATPFGQSERFLQIKKQSADANATLVVNIQALYPLLKKTVAARAESTGSQPMGMAPGVILDAIGLDGIKDIYCTVNMGESATQITGGMTYSELRGIFKMLAYRDGPVPQPSFVSAKWITVTSACFSLPDAYAALLGFVEGLNPMIGGMVQGQIKNLNKQLGVDLERDLIGSIGTQVIMANAMRPGASADSPTPLTELDQLYAFSLENAATFTKAVDALKGMAGPQAEKMFEKREYLGNTIYAFVQPQAKPGQKGFAYAITPKYLFIAAGTPAVIETALQGLGGKQPTLWQQPDVKAALAEVPANASVFEYQNTRAMVGSIIETFVQLAPFFAKGAADQSEEGSGDKAGAKKMPFDLSAKPDAATLAKYWSTSAGYGWRDSQGIYFQSKMNHVK